MSDRPDFADCGAGLLVRQAIRQVIWEMLNRHRPSGKPNIALVGSRRSGSTLLMQIIAHNPGVKSVDQPFSPFFATSHQTQFLPAVAGGHYTGLDREEEEQIREYVEKISDGRIHIREPWRFWRKDFHFRSDRIVLKTTNAHYLERILESLEFRMVRYFRHPIAQALSCINNRWTHQLQSFAQSKPLVDTVLSDDQRNLLQNIAQNGGKLERHVLCWCLENLPLFSISQTNTLTVFYENLVVEPKEVVRKISEHCELSAVRLMLSMVDEPSRSTRGLSEKSTVQAISSGDTSALVSRWRKQVSDDELMRVQHILDQFPGCPYSASDPMPTHSKCVIER
ncbi:MAG: sulfotransferase [Caulobacterales bacterium]|nr:sulfotransferase [Caulobacterales bacterium]